MHMLSESDDSTLQILEFVKQSRIALLFVTIWYKELGTLWKIKETAFEAISNLLCKIINNFKKKALGLAGIP